MQTKYLCKSVLGHMADVSDAYFLCVMVFERG